MKPKRLNMAAGAVGVLISLFVVTACSDVSLQSQHANAEPLSQSTAQAQVFANLAQRRESVDALYIEDTLTDLLPNQTFSVGDGAPAPLMDEVIVGTITAVEPGAGYATSADDPDTQHIVDYNDPDALWRAVVLHVSVVRSLSGTSSPGSELQVGLATEEPLEVVQSAFVGQRVLLPLDRRGFFRFNKSLYVIAQSGALLGVVRDDDSVSMPALGKDEADFLSEVDTLREINAENKQPDLEPVIVDPTTNQQVE